MFDLSRYRGRLVLLDKDALEALRHVSSMQSLRAWENVYILGRPPLHFPQAHPAALYWS